MLSSEDLTAAIISQLTWLPDILCCSAVCKTWLAASEKLQLHALDIPGDYEETSQNNQQLDERSLDSVTRLVLQWHEAGTFRSLASLSLQLDYSSTTLECRDSGRLPVFVMSILAIAGMWDNLQHCLIHADVDMEVPASLLSSKLQSLEIRDTSMNVKDCMSLAMVHRFSSLRSLCLGPIEWDLREDAPQVFIMESTFHKLTKLHLQYLPLQVSTGFTLSGCLPNLTDLHVRVFPRQAQAVLDLPRLTKLTLGLLCKTATDICRLVVRPESSLQELRVWGSADSIHKLYIRKLDLMFTCRRIGVSFNCPRLGWEP